MTARRHPRFRIGHGIDTQLHDVTVKMHASFGAQNPSHDGELASPHAVVRHSHAPPDATAEQWPPPPHVPLHVRSLLSKSHGPAGTVVVVVDETIVAGLRVAGAHSSCECLKLTTRWPPNSSVIWTAGGNGRGQMSG
jgi:hypothetical protein